MDKVTRQCSQTTTFLKRKESWSGIKLTSFCLLALPLGQTGSLVCGVTLERVYTERFWSVSDSLIVLRWPCLKSQGCHLIWSFFCTILSVLWTDLRKGSCMRGFEMCVCLWQFNCPEVTLSESSGQSLFCLPSPLSVLWTNLRKGLCIERFWSVFVWLSLGDPVWNLRAVIWFDYHFSTQYFQFCGLTWERVYILRDFQMCICLWQFDCPEVTLCGRQDVRIQLLTNLYPSWSELCFEFCILWSAFFSPGHVTSKTLNPVHTSRQWFKHSQDYKNKNK